MTYNAAHDALREAVARGVSEHGAVEEIPAFVVYGHGHNGDFEFTEPWDVVPTLDRAKAVAEKAMKTRGDNPHNVLSDGTPTLRWMEVFGPGIEESLGLEEVDGELVWGGC